MICKKCGTKFSDGLFCPECGTRMAMNNSGIDNIEEMESKFDESEEYDTKKYGSQGRLEEQRITTKIKVVAGEKKVFENKILFFDESIEVNENAKLEFRNCSFVMEKGCINICGENINLGFENCIIKNAIIDGCYSGWDKQVALTFRNCAIINEENDSLIKVNGKNMYFENCFIKTGNFLENRGSRFDYGRREDCVLEFRNCTIIKNMEGEFIRNSDFRMILKFENCSITGSNICFGSCIELIIENSILDSHEGMDLFRKNSFIF